LAKREKSVSKRLRAKGCDVTLKSHVLLLLLPFVRVSFNIEIVVVDSNDDEDIRCADIRYCSAG
jgi:hypothetical protein